MLSYANKLMSRPNKFDVMKCDAPCPLMRWKCLGYDWGVTETYSQVIGLLYDFW